MSGTAAWFLLGFVGGIAAWFNFKVEERLKRRSDEDFTWMPSPTAVLLLLFLSPGAGLVLAGTAAFLWIATAAVQLDRRTKFFAWMLRPIGKKKELKP